MTVNDLVDRLTNCSITYLPQAVHWSSLEQVHQDAPGAHWGISISISQTPSSNAGLLITRNCGIEYNFINCGQKHTRRRKTTPACHSREFPTSSVPVTSTPAPSSDTVALLDP